MARERGCDAESHLSQGDKIEGMGCLCREAQRVVHTSWIRLQRMPMPFPVHCIILHLLKSLHQAGLVGAQRWSWKYSRLFSAPITTSKSSRPICLCKWRSKRYLKPLSHVCTFSKPKFSKGAHEFCVSSYECFYCNCLRSLQCPVTVICKFRRCLLSCRFSHSAWRTDTAEAALGPDTWLLWVDIKLFTLMAIPSLYQVVTWPY